MRKLQNIHMWWYHRPLSPMEPLPKKMVIAKSYSFGVVLGVSWASLPKIFKIGPKTKKLWSFLTPPEVISIFRRTANMPYHWISDIELTPISSFISQNWCLLWIKKHSFNLNGPPVSRENQIGRLIWTFRTILRFSNLKQIISFKPWCVKMIESIFEWPFWS